MSTIQSYNPYQYHPIYTNSKSTTVLDDTLLTEKEIALANEYNDYLKMAQVTKKVLEIMANNGTMSDELKAEKRMYHEKMREGAFENVFNMMNHKTTCPVTGITIIHVGGQPYDLPAQDFKLNTANNSMTFGIGSVIPVRDPNSTVYLHVMDTSVGYLSPEELKSGIYYSHYRPKTEIEYDMAFDALINGIMGGNANWGHNMKLNDDIITMLERLGIDTSKDFSINDVSFSVKNGVLHATSNKNGNYFGTSYLNALMIKAYEQNMILA